MINIAGYKNWYLGVSLVLVGAAVVVSVLFGFHEGIDFTGGTLWQFVARSATGGAALSVDQVGEVFRTQLGISDPKVSSTGSPDEFLVRFGPSTEPEHQQYAQKAKASFSGFSEQSFSSIGPSVSAELKRNALWAMALVLVAISLYIAFAFRGVSYPVSSWTYGIITLVTLFHDVAIPAGVLAILGKYAHVEIDTNFIVALLVVMGFSVHDTIVVFDRIRENLRIAPAKKDFPGIVNASVNQTLARSFNTSLTLILVLIALLILGPANLHFFVLTLLIGVTTGIYSSVFVASPLLLVVQRQGK